MRGCMGEDCKDRQTVVDVEYAIELKDACLNVRYLELKKVMS
jgi:hypothetical protein